MEHDLALIRTRMDHRRRETRHLRFGRLVESRRYSTRPSHGRRLRWTGHSMPPTAAISVSYRLR
jgi:hypothetical protein